MTYAVFVEHMAERERREFDRKLSAPPPRPAGRPRGPRSSGTGDLMAAFGTARR